MKVVTPYRSRHDCRFRIEILNQMYGGKRYTRLLTPGFGAIADSLKRR